MGKIDNQYYLQPRNYNLKLLNYFSRHDGISAGFLLILILFYSPLIAVFIFLVPWIEYFWVYFRSKPISEFEKQKILEGISVKNRFIVRRAKTSQSYSLPKLRMITISENDCSQALRADESNNKSISKAIIAHEIGHLGHYDRMVFLCFKWSVYLIGAYFFYSALHEVYSFFKGGYEFDPRVVYLSLFLVIGLFLMQMTLSRISHRREYIADLEGFKLYQNGFMRFLDSGIKTEKRSRGTPIENRSRNLFSHPSFESRKSVFTKSIDYPGFNAKIVAFQWVFLLLFFYAATRMNGFYPVQIGTLGLFTMAFPIVAAMFNLACLRADYFEIRSLIYEYMLGALGACITVILLDYGYKYFVGESYVTPGYYPSYLEILIMVAYLFCRGWAALLHNARNIDLDKYKDY